MGLLRMRMLYYTVQNVHRLWVCLNRYPVCGKSAKVLFTKAHTSISSIRESFPLKYGIFFTNVSKSTTLAFCHTSYMYAS